MNATDARSSPTSCTRWRRSPFTDAGLAGEPGVEAGRPPSAVRRHLPQDPGVDVDVVQGLGAAAGASGELARGRDDGRGQQQPVRRRRPVGRPRGSQVTSHAGRGGQRQDVGGRRAPRAGRGPAARPAATRRSRRSPGPPSRRRRRAGSEASAGGCHSKPPVGPGKRAFGPISTTSSPTAAGSAQADAGPVAPCSTKSTSISRALRPGGPHGVRADRVPPLLGEGAPLAVPVGAGRAVGDAAAGEGEQDLDPLVPAVGGAASRSAPVNVTRRKLGLSRRSRATRTANVR